MQGASSDELAGWVRGHWEIENALHWVATSPSPKTCPRSAPATPAGHGDRRNLAISVHRLADATNIAAACRHVGRHPNRILPLLT